jgi:hypothetical protein
VRESFLAPARAVILSREPRTHRSALSRRRWRGLRPRQWSSRKLSRRACPEAGLALSAGTLLRKKERTRLAPSRPGIRNVTCSPVYLLSPEGRGSPFPRAGPTSFRTVETTVAQVTPVFTADSSGPGVPFKNCSSPLLAGLSGWDSLGRRMEGGGGRTSGRFFVDLRPLTVFASSRWHIVRLFFFRFCLTVARNDE